MGADVVWWVASWESLRKAGCIECGSGEEGGDEATTVGWPEEEALEETGSGGNERSKVMDSMVALATSCCAFRSGLLLLRGTALVNIFEVSPVFWRAGVRCTVFSVLAWYSIVVG